MPPTQVNISGCFSGLYSQFETMRFAWAAIALPENGITPAIIPADGPLEAHINLTYGDIDIPNWLGEWDVPPDDPVFLILLHAPHMMYPVSAGRLANGYLRPLADRLEELLDYNQPAILTLTQQFINGLRNAALMSMDVFFS